MDEKELHTLDVQARLEYASAGVAVVRALALPNKTMRYQEFTVAIGLKTNSESGKRGIARRVATFLASWPLWSGKRGITRFRTTSL